MWKYVSRRLKETLERTCNALDVCRNWRCSGGVHNSQENESSSSNCEEFQLDRNCLRVFSNIYVCTVNCGKSNGSSGDGKYEKKGRTFRDDNGKGNQLHDDLLGAITWSGAIVAGWYTSQIFCLNRRQYGWNPYSQGRYFNIISVPSRALHNNVFSHWVLTSPTPPSILAEKTLKEKFNFDSIPNKNCIESLNYRQKYNIVEINNDNETVSTSGISSVGSISSSTSSHKQTVNEAVGDLVKFLGDTEFKMGIQQISAGRYRSAVAHLKLASRHHHVGATFNLGLCYEQGLGITKNLKRAMECYQYASSMGHPKAMYNLGVFYAQGLGGLQKNHEAAQQCFMVAAKLGQNEAIEALSIGNDIKVVDPILIKQEKLKFL